MACKHKSRISTALDHWAREEIQKLAEEKNQSESEILRTLTYYMLTSPMLIVEAFNIRENTKNLRSKPKSK